MAAEPYVAVAAAVVVTSEIYGVFRLPEIFFFTFRENRSDIS